MTTRNEIEVPLTSKSTFIDVYKAVSAAVDGNQEEIDGFLLPFAKSAVDTLERPWVVEFEMTPNTWRPCFCGGVATEKDAQDMMAAHIAEAPDPDNDPINWRVTNQLERVREKIGETRIQLLNDLSIYFYDQQPIDA